MLSPLTFPLDRIVDADGRPLFEGRASKEMQAIAPMERAVCPYPGSRYKHEKPMNVSGLRQLRGHWGDLIEGLKYLRGVYPQSTPHIRYIDLWRICVLGESLPAFLIYRRQEPVPNGQVPTPVAGIYKVVIGLIHAAQQLAFTSLSRGAEKIDEELDHDHLYSFVEDKKLFIGPTEVCAGPEPLIRKVINALKDKTATLDPAQTARLCVGDERAFLEFSYCRMNSVVLSYLYSIVTESLYARVRRAAGPGGQSEEPSSPAEAQLALFAGLEKRMAQAILNGIIEVAISDPSGDGRLKDAARQMSELFNDGSPSPKVVSMLGERAQDSGVTEDIARYLHLEKIGAGVSQILKLRCLGALGLEDSPMSRDFSPPELKMRSLLSVMFGIQILPSLQVQSKGATVM